MSLLEQLRVATPCPMKWSQMKGNDRVRQCDRCKLKVYNLTLLKERDAYEFVTAKKCVTFFRRADGTVMTADCRGGFSERFWEKFGSMERTGLILLFGATFSALFFATVITVFGDHFRYYFGQSVAGMPADLRLPTSSVKSVPLKR
jgi:hypothetical protein